MENYSINNTDDELIRCLNEQRSAQINRQIKPRKKGQSDIDRLHFLVHIPFSLDSYKEIEELGVKLGLSVSVQHSEFGHSYEVSTSGTSMSA